MIRFISLLLRVSGAPLLAIIGRTFMKRIANTLLHKVEEQLTENGSHVAAYVERLRPWELRIVILIWAAITVIALGLTVYLMVNVIRYPIITKVISLIDSLTTVGP